MLSWPPNVPSAWRAARGGVAAAILAAAALSCAALIGIDDRLADDLPDGALPDVDLPDVNVDAGDDAGGALTYGLGDGHTGALTVTGGQNIFPNSYAPLLANAQGTDRLAYGPSRGANFEAGDLVMIWQAATSTPPAGTTSPVDLSDTNVGQWEMARVKSISPGPDAGGDAGGGGEMTLDHAIGVARAYTMPGAQIIRVPEYTDVTIQPNGYISATQWDGTVGGVLAFYAKGTLRNDGYVYAEGAGFRGGSVVVTGNGSLTNCAAEDGLPDGGYAYKGEGIVLGVWGDAGGRGHRVNGGGGGNCLNAGGGGGGNGGVGGAGGWSNDGDRDVGGRPGSALAYKTVLGRLTFGGGGGAGEVDNGRDNTPGGRGGGVLLVRANEVLGTGRLSARGYRASRHDYSGGSGGGAGGSAIVQAAGTLACGQLSVAGGGGGGLESYNAANGPGGGGGGGRALVQGKATACSIENRAGAGGRWDTGNDPRGSSPEAGADLAPPFTVDPEVVGEPYCATCP